MYAGYRGVQKLLDATGQWMVDVGTVDGHTPLHVAAVNGLRQIAQVLVETVCSESEMSATDCETSSVLVTDSKIWVFMPLPNASRRCQRHCVFMSSTGVPVCAFVMLFL